MEAYLLKSKLLKIEVRKKKILPHHWGKAHLQGGGAAPETERTMPSHVAEATPIYAVHFEK